MIATPTKTLCSCTRIYTISHIQYNAHYYIIISVHDIDRQVIKLQN